MVKVDINLNGAYRKLSAQAMTQGRRAVANQALADMNQFVPMKEGILRMTGTIDLDATAVNYNTPYARRHFYAPGGWNYTTPGTGPRWDLKAKGMFMSDWVEAFKKGAGW